jgi:5,10-methylenetetrahydrofolate reductase
MSFADVVNQKDFSLVVQMDPPKGTEVDPLLASALAIRGRVDAVVFSDNPMAIMRMNPVAPCHMLQHKNMDAILTLNSRDRNRLAFQGELLAAWALGIRSLLLRVGRDSAYGDHPLAVPCNDLKREDMLEAVQSFREGKDLAGQPLSSPVPFHTGIAVDVSDDEQTNRNRAADLPRLAKLGAQFVFLGPTYNLDTVQGFSEAAAGTGVKLFASVLLLKSAGMAKYLNTMPGTPNVPDPIIKRIRKAPVKPRACLEIAAETIQELKKHCSGAVVIPLGWEDKLPELLDLLSH